MSFYKGWAINAVAFFLIWQSVFHVGWWFALLWVGVVVVVCLVRFQHQRNQYYERARKNPCGPEAREIAAAWGFYVPEGPPE